MALSLAELQKAQAEVEGFQLGPQPALNSANLNTQNTLGNPQTPSTSPAPYYPSKETPNLKMSTRDMSSELANNFVILDTFSALPAAPMQYSSMLGLPQLPVTKAAITSNFFTAYNPVTGVFSAAQPAFTDISGNLAMGQIPTGGSGSTYLRGDGSWATPAAGAAGTLRLTVSTLPGPTSAIDPHTPATYVITDVGANLMTIAAPTVGTDDGLVIQITAGTSAAHTLTGTGGTLRVGTAAVTHAAFASYYGASIELMAYQGNWYVMASNNIAAYT